MARGQLLDARDDAIVVGDITEGEEILDRSEVGFLPKQRVAEQPFQFEAKATDPSDSRTW